MQTRLPARPSPRYTAAMIEAATDVDTATLALYDDIIDVRSPSEFAEDHIPGAINLPVLNDAERAEVGTVYVQQSRFLARRMGAARVARNVASHLDSAFKDKGPRYRPLLYCWRGGQRSNSMATILSQIGWRVGVLDGGYRTWRRRVVASLHDDAAGLKIMLLDGQTGTAKTELLRRLDAKEVQTLDLEGMAAHRGSVFGAMAAHPQPGQKLFESKIFSAIRDFDTSRPVLVEAESRQIGRRTIPPAIWAAMNVAPWIEIAAKPEHRAAYLVDFYTDIISTISGVEDALVKLQNFHSKEQLAQWRQLAANGEYRALALCLINQHYDPLYKRSRKRREGSASRIVTLEKMDETSIESAAGEIEKILNTAF